MFARMRVTIVLTAAMCVFATPGCQNPNNTSKQAGQQQAKPAAAQDGASQLTDGTPPKIETLTFIAAGRLHESQGHLPAAIQQFQLALNEDPRNAQLLGHLGVLYDRVGNGQMAEKMYREALSVQPDNATLHNNLAFSCITRKKWAEAQVELTRAIELAPEFARARINLGMVLAQQGEFEGAHHQFQMVLPAEDAWYNLGLMYQSKHKPVDAAYAYQQALAINPGLTAAREQLKKMPSTTLVAAADKLAKEKADAAAKQELAKAVEAIPSAATTQPAENASVQPGNVFADEAAMLRELDALLPEWQRTPELIADFASQSSGNTDQYAWFDLQYSPAAFESILPDKTDDLARVKLPD